MKSSTLAELLNMTPAERIQLAQDLWDSLDETDIPPLTDDQVEELKRRLVSHDADPDSAVPWNQVRERLRSRFGV